jgi:hypothetical protein
MKGFKTHTLQNRYRYLKILWILLSTIVVLFVVPSAYAEPQLVHLFNFTYVQKYSGGEIDYFQNKNVSIGSGSINGSDGVVLGNVVSMTRLNFANSDNLGYIEIPSITDNNVTITVNGYNITLTGQETIGLDVNNDSRIEYDFNVISFKSGHAKINISYEYPSQNLSISSLVKDNKEPILVGIGVLILFLILFNRGRK